MIDKEAVSKAIEAAREALKNSYDYVECDFQKRDTVISGYAKSVGAEAKSALAALPDKPMTEDDILRIMVDTWRKNNSMWDVIQALKAANVLYVRED